MNFYKIKHKKSDFFWQPDIGSGNIGKTGKVYSRKPRLQYVTGSVVCLNSYHRKQFSKTDLEKIEVFNINLEQNRRGMYGNKFRVSTNVNDWEIVEIKVV